MQRQLVSSDSKFEKLYGHSRAVAVGDLIFVAGTVGFDYETHTISEDPAEQTRQTFRNIENALAEVGASFSDVVQLVTYFTNHEDWDAIGEVLHEQLKDVRPTNAGVRVELIDPRMKIEISATAVRKT
ncbi:MAG: RidA family protein [SAR324 cluster bacterium]|nr:RidA family protein [SAR324 cluster bacterium]